MSALVPFNSAVPAFLASGWTGNSDLSAHASLSFPVISIKGKVFTIVRDGEKTVVPNPKDPESPAHALDVVIVKASPTVAKAYYDVAYKDGEDIKPRCFSNDGKRPDSSLTSPCAKSCATCPFNKFGSRKNPDGTMGKGKACSDSVRIAVASASALDDPMMIRVPATSMKALGELGRVLDRHHVPYQAVLTKIAFDTATPTPKLTFTPMGYVDQATYENAVEVSKGDLVSAIIGEGMGIPESAPVQEAAPADPLAVRPAYVQSPEPAKRVTRAEVQQVIQTAESLIDGATEAPEATVIKNEDELASTFSNLNFDD